MNHDLIIIGAGPIGLACAIEAKRTNLNYTVIEKGCLVNSIFHYPTNMTFFSTSDRLEIGEVPFISHGVKPTRTEALEYYRRVKESWQLNVKTYEQVKEIRKSSDKFLVTSNKNFYQAKYVIISTGFFDFPNLMNIPGEELSKVKHYYTEPHPFAYQDIIVIGGGNSAVDVALETYRRGANVTMVIKDSTLQDGVKYWVKPDIENRIMEGEIKAYFNSKVKSISEGYVDIITPEGDKIIKNDFVFAMTGYKPDFNLLQNAGIDFEPGEDRIPKYDESNYETNVNKLFLAGVVCGGMKTGKWFIENARIHAPKIFKKIMEYEKTT